VLITEFYRCIATDESPPVNSAAGREVVRILDLVWEQIGYWQPWVPMSRELRLKAQGD